MNHWTKTLIFIVPFPFHLKKWQSRERLLYVDGQQLQLHGALVLILHFKSFIIYVLSTCAAQAHPPTPNGKFIVFLSSGADSSRLPNAI